MKLASGYFLGLGAFVFGLWGTWGVLIDQNSLPNALAFHLGSQSLVLSPTAVRRDIFQFSLALSLIAPLVALIIILRRDSPYNRSSEAEIRGPVRRGRVRQDRERQARALSVSLLVLTIYATAAQWLSSLVSGGFTHVIPRLLNVADVHEPTFDWWTNAQTWEGYFSVGLFLLTILSVIAAALIATFDVFRAVSPDFYSRGSASIVRQMENSGALERSILSFRLLLLAIAFHTTVAASFVGLAAQLLVRSLFDTFAEGLRYLWRLFRYLVVPVLVFSLMSFVTILVVVTCRSYNDGLSTDWWTVWSAILAVGVYAVIFCSAAFGFAKSLDRRFVFAGTEASMLFSVVGYFVASVAVTFCLPSLWMALNRGGIESASFRPGGVLVANGAALLVTGILLVGTTSQPLRELLFGTEADRQNRAQNVMAYAQLGTVFALVAIVLVVSANPIFSGLWNALRA
jgi:hypothetical protein